jgi:putative protease
MLSCKVKASNGENLYISFNDGENEVSMLGSIVTPAINSPTSKETITKKITSLGNTPFIISNFDIDIDDNIFINMSELKNIRRNLVEELIKIRENKIPHEFIENELKQEKAISNLPNSKININVLVRTEEQLLTCINEKVDTIYVEDVSLYQKYKDKYNVYLKLSRVLKKFKEYKNEKLLIEETGSLFKYAKSNEVVTDYYLNVVNSYAFKFLEERQVKRITLSIENKEEDIKNIVKNINYKEKIELFIYGRPEVMITKYCPLNMLVNKNKVCNICLNNDKYYLKDQNNRAYPIRSSIEEEHLTHIFYYQNIDLTEDVLEYQALGISNFRIDLFDESSEEIKTIIRKIKNVKIM